MHDRAPDPDTLPIVEERLDVDKRRIETGRVRVAATTEIVTDLVQADVESSEVVVTRVPQNRQVTVMPIVSTIDGITIIPVVEERLVVEKRMFVTEEIHVTRRVTTEKVELPVERRIQRATITRTAPDTNIDEE